MIKIFKDYKRAKVSDIIFLLRGNMLKTTMIFVFVTSFFVFLGCNGQVECKVKSDCDNEMLCNVITNKCEKGYEYQSEKFDDVQWPYLFINKFLVGEGKDRHPDREIRIVDLKKREYVRTLPFPEKASDIILKNNYNGKFYFYKDYESDNKPWGLFEIDPKTGIIKNLASTYNAYIEAIGDNGKIYYVTGKACENKDYPDALSNKIGIFDVKNNTEKFICVPALVAHLYKNHDGNIYTMGTSRGAHIFQINPEDDTIKKVFQGKQYGGWNIASAMGDEIYFLDEEIMNLDWGILKIDLKTPDFKLEEIPFNIGACSDGTYSYPSSGGWQIGKDVFMFSYRFEALYSNLVKYNSETGECDWLYSDMTNGWKSYYDKDSNSIAVVDGLIFFMDDYELKSFRGDNYKLHPWKKKF